MRVVHVYSQDYQPQTVMPRCVDGATGKALPHKIVAIDGHVVRPARGGGFYEAPATVQIDTSKWLALVVDETFPHSRCRLHAEGLVSPLLIDKSPNFVILELGFDPSFLNNKTPDIVAATDFLY